MSTAADLRTINDQAITGQAESGERDPTGSGPTVLAMQAPTPDGLVGAQRLLGRPVQGDLAPQLQRILHRLAGALHSRPVD